MRVPHARWAPTPPTSRSPSTRTPRCPKPWAWPSVRRHHHRPVPVLSALERWSGSDSRRVLRGFLGRWLTGQLHTGSRRRAAPFPARPLAQLAPPGLARARRVAGERRPAPCGGGSGSCPGFLHPWVWDATRKLWESRHPRPAVRAVATAIDKRLQDKLGRHDLADDKLLQEAFSDKPAQPGKPRLRIPGEPTTRRSPACSEVHRSSALAASGLSATRPPARQPTGHRRKRWSNSPRSASWPG